VPAVSKALENSSPTVTIPELKLPSTAVTVCPSPSSLLHSTLPPVATTMEPGRNDLSMIETLPISGSGASGSSAAPPRTIILK